MAGGDTPLIGLSDGVQAAMTISSKIKNSNDIRLIICNYLMLAFLISVGLKPNAFLNCSEKYLYSL